MLAYLAVSQEATRGRLVGTFWPERTEARARHALSQVLHKLRRDLGGCWLEADQEVLRMADGVDVDATVFEQAVQQQDFETALGLYRGPFLDGWGLRGARDFEIWIDGQRSRFARMHASASRELVRERERAGDLDGSVAAMLRWWESHPFDEEAHAETVHLLLRSGRRAEAVRLHRDFLARLAAEDMQASPELSRQLEPMLLSVGAGDGRELVAEDGRKWVSPADGSAHGPPSRDRLVVLPFENLTGDPHFGPLGRLVADWITEGLDRGRLGRIISADALRYEEAQGAGTKGEDSASLIRVLGGTLEAGILVTGSFYLVGGALELRARAVDLTTRELLGVMEPVRTSLEPEAEALALVRERVLGLVATVLEKDWTGVPGTLELGLPPPTFAAYRAYCTGLEYFVREEYPKAIHWFEKAISLDPEFRRPVFLASASCMNLGEWNAVAELVESLRTSGDRLSPYEVASLEWQEANLAGDRIRAYEVGARAWKRYPGTIAQFVHGVDALRVNRPGEAVAVLRDLHTERGWMRGFHTYWEMLTAAHHMLGDHRAELVAARQARTRFPSLLSHLGWEVRALAPGGLSSEMEGCLAEAPDLPPQPGWSPARVTLLASAELRAHGHSDAGAGLAEVAAAWLQEEAGPGPMGAAQRGEMARAQALAGRWREAEKILENLAPQFPQNVEYRGRLAVFAARRGDREAAASGDRELQRLSRPYLFGRETLWRARVAALLGDRDRALRLLVRAFSEGHAYGPELHADPDLEPLRSHEGFRRVLRPKG